MPARLDLIGRTLLAVVVLTAGGTPLWRHSHPGGNRPHHHHPADDHDHDHDGLAESHAHVHFWWFGFDFTLPEDGDDDHSDRGRPVFLVPALSAIELNQSLTRRASEGSCLPFCDSPAPALIAGGAALPAAAPFRCKTAIAAPLCDIARHERSGVQLT